MVPQLADHVTDWLAVNVWVFRACRFTAAGVTMIGEVATVATVLAVRPLPSVAVAVTVQELAVAGAVKRPPLVINPQLAFHVEAWLAVNCRVPFTGTVGLTGEIVMPVPPVPERATVWGL